MTKKMLSRLDVARELGRRVSRGEFERIFNRLRVHTYVHTKRRANYRPRSLVLHEQSPKFKRKHGDTVGVEHSRRDRFTVK